MFSNKLEILYTAIYYKPTEAKCFEIYRFEAKHSIWSERWGKHLEKFLISHQQSDSWKHKKNKETKAKNKYLIINFGQNFPCCAALTV